MRRPVNKARSARQFRGQIKRTPGMNMRRPGRGGFRL